MIKGKNGICKKKLIKFLAKSQKKISKLHTENSKNRIRVESLEKNKK